MAEHQRKIDLQSPNDLKYLIENIRTAAQQIIDLHLPPSAAQGEDDAFRSKVDELVQQYINRTLTLALPSISINGLDASPSILKPASEKKDSEIDPNDPSYEPYDARLAKRLRDLYASLEEETTRVAVLRREAPQKAAQAYLQALQKEIENADIVYEARKVDIANTEVSKLGYSDSITNEDLKETWDQSRRRLEELRNVTKVKADLERALRAAREVEKP
jgi:kinetochor protein Mis14/NSL1